MFIDKWDLKSHQNIHSQEKQARHKKQEQIVALALKASDIAFKREHQIDFKCIGNGTFARIDFTIMSHGHIIFLEVDEGQHRFGYGEISCDMRRMAKVSESLACGEQSMPIVFIRYNPDAYIVDGLKLTTKKKDRESRLVELILSIDSPIYTKNPLTIQYMYYGMTKGKLDVLEDPEYNHQMASCCLQAIV